MNFDGFTPYPIERFSSLVEMDRPTNLPIGVLPVARNVQFRLTRVRTRDGIQNQYGFQLPDGGMVTGLAALKVGGPAGDLQAPVAFSSNGVLYVENPVGSGKVTPVNGPLVALPANASMQVAPAYAKGFYAFGNLKQSLALPVVHNPALGTLDPASMLPFGQPWAAKTEYEVGECITPASPVGGNGIVYQCVQAGTSGAVQPDFTTAQGGPNPATAGAATGSGAANWNDPSNVTEADGLSYATATLSVYGDESDILVASGFGFNIPNGVTITGVLVTFNAYNTLGLGSVLHLALTNQSITALSRYVQTNVGDATAVSSGGSSDLWGTALTPADVNDSGFGVQIQMQNFVNEAVTQYVQNVTIQIFYSAAGSGNINDGSVIWSPNETPTLGPSAQAGNVALGLRYMVVLFVNRNGYISGMTQASVVSAVLADSVHQIVATFPTGPSNTVARILAFTPAGQLGQLQGTGISSAGPYFWISPVFPNGIFNLSAIAPGVTVADVVSGVTMNSTLINDNVTTTATLNFTDDYLKATLNDVSDYFRKIQIPGCSDVYYSQVQQRMFYAADILPSGWYVSLPNDPESVYGDTGVLQVAENNGENRVAVRDFNGATYLLKEKSGYVLAPSATDPSTWDPVPQWGSGTGNGCGPCGPRAVDVATNFMCFVHRSGVYIFEGGQPYRISKEVPITWSKINWAAQQTIWVVIDDERREILIGVPYGQSIVPNLILKLNYEELPAWSPPSFAPPIHFSPYVGKEIAAGGCYKWSVDDIAANCCIRAERILPVPVNGWPPWFDLATTQSQVLFGSSNPDGWVTPIIPGSLDDNGTGIDSYIETACPAIMNAQGQVLKSLLGQNRLGGVQMNHNGKGQGSVYVLGGRAVDPKDGGPPLAGKVQANVGVERKLKKPWIEGVPYSCGGSMTNEFMRLRITNDKRAGSGFDIEKAVIYAQPVTSARPG